MIFGVNPAKVDSHKRFADKNKFNFPLLVDEDRSLARACDALKENGTSIQRTVLIIDKNGVVCYRKRGMPPDSELLEAIQKL